MPNFRFRRAVWLALPGLVLLAAPVFSTTRAGADVAAPLAASPHSSVENARKSSAVAPPSRFALSGALTVQTLNTYLYRGFLTEERGTIVQSWLDVKASIPIGETLKSVDLHGQFWNSFGDGPTGTGGMHEPPRLWTERDWTVGATASFRGGLTIDAGYAQLRAPNGSFLDLDEASLTIAYDDADASDGASVLFRGWHPSLTLVQETLGREDLSGESGTFLGVGIAPTFRAWRADEAPTISVPLLTGWSLGHYFEDSAGIDHPFGFVDVGVDLNVPLRDSSWTIKFSVHGIYLGDTTSEFARQRDLFVVVTAGLSWAF